tara:strand:+ start:232 stop:453 length:222 start_codon:yes stop_codon:yes gene_type:complete
METQTYNRIGTAQADRIIVFSHDLSFDIALFFIDTGRLIKGDRTDEPRFVLSEGDEDTVIDLETGDTYTMSAR